MKNIKTEILNSNRQPSRDKTLQLSIELCLDIEKTNQMLILADKSEKKKRRFRLFKISYRRQYRGQHRRLTDRNLIFGAPKRVRTSNQRIRSPLLYPIELWMHGVNTIIISQ